MKESIEDALSMDPVKHMELDRLEDAVIKKKATGRIFTVGTEEELIILKKAASKEGVIVVPIEHPFEIMGVKVKRVDILPMARVNKILINYLIAHRIKVFRWTIGQWEKFVNETKSI